MAEKITNYQCPNCTGPLHFDSGSGKLVCDYCGSSFTVEEVENFYAEKNRKAEEAAKKEETEQAEGAEQTAGAGTEQEEAWDYSGLSGEWGEDAKKMRVYNCPSCGAELVCEETTGATSCPYCGNPSIIPGTFSGTLKPDFVIPFKIDKENAVKKLKDHYKGKHFVPRTFTAENHIQKIQGLYVPFWLFDAQAQGSASYEGTKTHTRTSGDERITRTEYYHVHREGNAAFEKVPVDGSKKMPDDYMDSVEPYNYGELTNFSLSYLPGYMADKYDVSAEESAQRADERCKNTLTAELRNTVTGYSSVTTLHEDVSLSRGKVHYALFPVWILNTKWKGKDFLFILNGQTGKMVGNVPISRKSYWLTFTGLTAVIMAVLTCIYMIGIR